MGWWRVDRSPCSSRWWPGWDGESRVIWPHLLARAGKRTFAKFEVLQSLARPLVESAFTFKTLLSAYLMSQRTGDIKILCLPTEPVCPLWPLNGHPNYTYTYGGLTPLFSENLIFVKIISSSIYQPPHYTDTNHYPAYSRPFPALPRLPASSQLLLIFNLAVGSRLNWWEKKPRWGSKF